MPTGPKGEKRPADVNAITIAKIATDEIITVGTTARRRPPRSAAT
jgi:hypothetical protein